MSISYQKINLADVKETPKGRRKKLFKAVKIFLPALAVIVILLGVLGWVAYGQYRIIKADVADVNAEVGAIKTSLKKQDIRQIKGQNALLRASLIKTQADLGKDHFVTKIPIAAGYYNDAQHLLKAGLLASQAGDLAIDSVTPFADVLGLQGSNKTNVNAQEKAQIVVRDVIPALIPKVDQINEKITEIKGEVDQIDPHRYPEGFSIKGQKVRELLSSAKTELDTIASLLPEVKPILQVLPQVAGEPTPKTYMILFQNDKELRPTGGFITSYALAKVQGGRLVSIFSEDIYKLDSRLYPKDPPPDYLRKYLNQVEWGIRDANVYPDYATSAQNFERFFRRIPNEPKIDGVIALDTEFVRRLLTVTGPVKSKKLNETFSADTNNLGIPDVVYKLELYSEKIFQSDPNRKGFIGEIMNEVIAKVSSFPPEKFQPFLLTLYNAAIEKHLLFYFDDPAAQTLAEKYSLAGRVVDYSGDYLEVNDSNFGGLKANLYIKQRVDQDITVAADGTVTKTVTVTLTNPVRGDGWLNSIYLNWQRILTPLGSKLISDDVPRDFTQGVELGKQVFRSYSATVPLKSTKAVYTYQLPFKIKKGDSYKMLVQKQPGMDATFMTIKINGQTKKEFNLMRDEEFNFSF